MRFLADENLHGDLVGWLRSRGHDVSYAAETMAGEPDESLLRRAREDARVLITDDKDFGELVFRKGLASSGVLLLRLRSPSVQDRLGRIAAAWTAIEPRLSRSFVVVSDHRIRVRPLP